MTLKGQTRDPNTLRAQYLENYLSYRLNLVRRSVIWGMLSGHTNNVPWKWAWPRSRDPDNFWHRTYLQNYLS